MANGPLFPLIRHLRRSLETTGVSVLTDAQLLQRWFDQRDEAAFEVLLWRHGPLVLGVCKRLLRDAQQIEDAFQAVFLILIRKGSSLHNRSSLASWLYKIAYRCASRLRTLNSRRRDREQLAVEPIRKDADEQVWRDLRPVLDDEIGRLPERYRSAFILCYLQGKTNPEAARELGCPVGTIVSRLAWARERLRNRMTRRGVTLTAALLVSLLPRAAEAALTPGLVTATVGLTTAGVVPAAVSSLVKGVLQTMVWARIKLMALVAVVGLLGVGGGLLYQGRGTFPPLLEPAAAAADPVRPAPAKDLANVVQVPSKHDGILILVGTEIKEGETVPEVQVIKIRGESAEKRYRRLRVGDKVEEGQLLARLDDQLVRDELAIADAKIEGAKAEMRASEKTRDEAKSRFEAMASARQKVIGIISDEEFRGAKLTWDRYIEEATSKKEAVKIAQMQRKSSETVLRMHEIRSPVSGTIRGILKKRGEAVKALETVFQIEISEEG
jgi:RNA polymerase sigma factor (sigma-70 family)